MASTSPAEKPTVDVGDPEKRFFRQAGIVPGDELAKREISVVGVGAIGRQVALQLACMGAKAITIIDPDTVTHSNRTTQGYRMVDVGKHKVDALEAAILEVDPTIKITKFFDEYRAKYRTRDMFCCVDDIEVRRQIWEHGGSAAAFWADGRMQGETYMAFFASSEDARTGKAYATTLHKKEESQQGACGEAGTIYSAGGVAGWMLSYLNKTLRGMPLEHGIQVSMFSSEMSVLPWPDAKKPSASDAVPV